MKIGDVIARIQQACPDFATVDHLMTSPSDFEKPAALVTPVRNRGSAPSIMIPGAYDQDVSSIIGVYVILERRQNGAFDNGVADLFDTLTTSLRTALVNWYPTGLIQPIVYAGGEMAPYETGLVAWREDFAIEFEMRLP